VVNLLFGKKCKVPKNPIKQPYGNVGSVVAATKKVSMKRIGKL